VYNFAYTIHVLARVVVHTGCMLFVFTCTVSPKIVSQTYFQDNLVKDDAILVILSQL